MPGRLKYLLMIVLAALGCLVPSAWVALPAGVVLTLILPGWFLIGALRGLDRHAGRLWVAFAASFAGVPVVLSWVWRVSNDRWAILAALVALNAVLWLLGSGGRCANGGAPMFISPRARRFFGVMVAFVAACVFGSYWVPEAAGRVGVRAAHDYVKHHAVLYSLEHYRLPLRNVFYAAEPGTPYYYYQYYYHLAAALKKLSAGRVSNGLAFGVTSAMLAAVFVALVYLLAREVTGSENGALLAAACVSVVGGWDAVPVLIRVLSGHPPPIVLDSWAPCPWRIHNLMTQFMWCPQHVAAVVTLMLGALWLRRAPQARWWLVIGPVLLAGILGTSAYLAMAVYAAVGGYVLLRLWASRREPARLGRLAVGLVAVAGLTVLLGGWQAWGYHLMNQRYPGGLTVVWDRFDYAWLGRLLPAGPLANYLDAPWILLVDLGLPALAMVVVSRDVWRRLWADPGLRVVLLAGVIGTVTLFTVHSTTNPIDYGFRVTAKPLQVIAAICAGAVLVNEQVRGPVRRWRRVLLVGGVLLGLPVGLYEAPLMAVRTLLITPADRPDSGALRYLRDGAPREAVVQADPMDRVSLPQLIERQMGVCDPNDPHVRVFFPQDFERMRRLAELVEQGLRADSADRSHAALRAVGATHVLLGRRERERFGAMSQFDDPAWFERVYADECARVYAMRQRPEEPADAAGQAPGRGSTP